MAKHNRNFRKEAKEKVTKYVKDSGLKNPACKKKLWNALYKGCMELDEGMYIDDLLSLPQIDNVKEIIRDEEYQMKEIKLNKMSNSINIIASFFLFLFFETIDVLIFVFLIHMDDNGVGGKIPFYTLIALLIIHFIGGCVVSLRHNSGSIILSAIGLFTVYPFVGITYFVTDFVRDKLFYKSDFLRRSM